MGNLPADTIRLLREWLESDEIRVKLQAVSDRAMKRLSNDAEIRVPRSEQERANGFSVWLSGHRTRYVEFLHREFELEFPGIAKYFNDPLGLWDYVVEGIWEEISNELLRYAVRGLAFRRMATKFRDGFVPGEPALLDSERLWEVPVFRRLDAVVIDRIYFDFDGSPVEREIHRAA